MLVLFRPFPVKHHGSDAGAVCVPAVDLCKGLRFKVLVLRGVVGVDLGVGDWQTEADSDGAYRASER